MVDRQCLTYNRLPYEIVSDAFMKQMMFKLICERIIIPSKIEIKFPMSGWMIFAVNNCCGRENGAIIESCESANVSTWNGPIMTVGSTQDIG